MNLIRRTPRHRPATEPTRYPNGTFIKTEKGYFYILGPTKRYRLISERALASWSPQRVVTSTEAAVVKYRIAAKMKFRNGSLIWNLSDAKLYLIEDGKRRHVVSPDVLDKLNAGMDEVITVSIDEVNLHEQGEDIT